MLAICILDFFYSLNVQGQGRCTALSRSAPCTAGLGLADSRCLRFKLTARPLMFNETLIVEQLAHLL